MANAVDLTEISTFIGASLVSGWIFYKLKQPALVGYIIAGIILGPSALGLIDSYDTINYVAELGVLMLLFFMGLELSIDSFKKTINLSLFCTMGQIAFSLLIFFILSKLLLWPVNKAIMLAFIFAISSTAVAMRILEEIDAKKTEVGQKAIGILIAQDLALIPMLLVIDNMSGQVANPHTIWLKLLVGIGILFLVIWYFSKHAIADVMLWRWMRVNKSEIIVLAGVGFCFIAAALSGFIGLSGAYGAFIAGLIVGNTPAKKKMMEATLPIKSLLLVAFFVSIGLLIDLAFVWNHLWLVLGMLFLVIFVKTAMNVMILHVLKQPKEQILQIGTVLGQVGEFSFVLAATGLERDVFDLDTYKLATAVIALSLALSSLWFIAAQRFESTIEKKRYKDLMHVVKDSFNPNSR